MGDTPGGGVAMGVVLGVTVAPGEGVIPGVTPGEGVALLGVAPGGSVPAGLSVGWGVPVAAAWGLGEAVGAPFSPQAIRSRAATRAAKSSDTFTAAFPPSPYSGRSMAKTSLPPRP